MNIRYSFFPVSLVIILVLTAAAKLIGATGNAHLLDLPDPLFGFSSRTMMLLAAGVEVGLAVSILICGWSVPTVLASLWFSSILVIYRVALAVIAPSAPCPCLGTLTEQLHLSPTTASVFMSIVLGYILAGSFVGLARLHRAKAMAS